MPASRGMRMMQMHYFYEMTGCCSIHRDAEKGSSPKPRFIRPHTCTVPGRMVAGRLFIKLPRRTLLGNSPPSVILSVCAENQLVRRGMAKDEGLVRDALR